MMSLKELVCDFYKFLYHKVDLMEKTWIKLKTNKSNPNFLLILFSIKSASIYYLV